MKKIIYIITFVLLISFSASSCTEIEIINDYLHTSTSNCTFDSSGEQAVLVKIETKGTAWEFENKANWLSVEKVDEETLKIRANESEEFSVRTAIIYIRSGEFTQEIKASQFPIESKTDVLDLPLGTGACISRNFKHIAYITIEYDEDYNPIVTAVQRDLETGETKEIPVIENEYGSPFSAIVAISDDGETLLYGDYASTGSVIYKNGKATTVTLPEGYNTPSVSNMSADGSIMVGYAYDDNYKIFPIKWTNMVPEVLDHPKTMLGNDIYAGSLARGCSADGRVIYGSEWDQWSVIYWIDEELHFPGEEFASKINIDGFDYITALKLQAEKATISQNGRYIVCYYSQYSVLNTFEVNEVVYPAIIDTETGDAKIFRNRVDASSSSVTNDGIIFAATPSYGSTSSFVIDSNTGVDYSLSEWMQNNAGIAMDDKRIVYGISADGSAFFGQKITPTPFGTSNPFWYISNN